MGLSSAGTYMPIPEPSVFLGIGEGLDPHSGFMGDLREFYLNAGRIDPAGIPAMMSNVKLFEWSVMAYYQLSTEIGILSDSFRDQQGKVVVSTDNSQAPILYIDEGSELVCDSLDQNAYEDLPLIGSGFQT